MRAKAQSAKSDQRLCYLLIGMYHISRLGTCTSKISFFYLDSVAEELETGLSLALTETQ